MGSLPNPLFGGLFLCKILWGYIYTSSAPIPTASVTRGVLIFTYIAIPRYRLYDIDVVINRTLVYSSLIATLVVLYFGVIVSLQSVFVILTGQRSTLAFVVSTLLIAALFTPLRRRIRSFIDGCFYSRNGGSHSC